jgi:hypothetical protein
MGLLQSLSITPVAWVWPPPPSPRSGLKKQVLPCCSSVTVVEIYMACRGVLAAPGQMSCSEKISSSLNAQRVVFPPKGRGPLFLITPLKCLTHPHLTFKTMWELEYLLQADFQCTFYWITLDLTSHSALVLHHPLLYLLSNIRAYAGITWHWWDYSIKIHPQGI